MFVHSNPHIQIIKFCFLDEGISLVKQWPIINFVIASKFTHFRIHHTCCSKTNDNVAIIIMSLQLVSATRGVHSHDCNNNNQQ
jgi:hypothetical protein